MGSPKALLTAEGRTFLRRAVETLRAGGCGDVVAVVPVDDAIRAEAEATHAGVVTNRDPESEQAASLRLALDALPDGCSAAIVLPVDHPLVAPATVRALIDAFEASDAPVVLPTRNGEPGHPALISKAVFDEVTADLPEGLRTILARHTGATTFVEVEDTGVVADLDTPADLARHLPHG